MIFVIYLIHLVYLFIYLYFLIAFVFIIVDYFEDEDYYYIEMGLHGVGMDLFDYIELNNTMHESEIRSIFRQVALAIQHLHHHGIVHRDIKDENVILDEYGNIQLIDFGSSAYVKPGRKYDTFCGTIDYAAPEVGCYCLGISPIKQYNNISLIYLIYH